MASCEKCWTDSSGNPDLYSKLVKSRNCTPEEQAAGYEVVDECPKCKRKTMHIYCHTCMACGYKTTRQKRNKENAVEHPATKQGVSDEKQSDSR